MKRFALVLLSLGCVAPAAEAQMRPEARPQTPTIELRTGFGASNYLHADIEYIAPTVLVALRAGSGRIAVEPEFAFAWHTEQDTFPGVAGPVVVRSSRQFRSAGVNVIARGRGRVSPFFGGGVGVYSERRRTTTDGQGQTLSFGPRAGTQIVGGLDIRAARRITVFGQGRYEVRSFSDIGGGSVFQGFAGVSFVLR
jgi:hypothetical protein